MNISAELIKAFNLEHKSAETLINISTLVDAEKKDLGYLSGVTDEDSQVASVIAALMLGKSTYSIGNEIYGELNKLILARQKEELESEIAEEEIEKRSQWKDSGSYGIIQTATGVRFTLRKSNGEVLMISEVYSSVDSCVRGIEAMQKASIGEIEDQTDPNAPKKKHPKYEIYSDHAGSYRFRLKAKNGEILSVSNGYRSLESCVAGISETKKIARNSPLENSY